MDFHFILEKKLLGALIVEYTPSQEQLADNMTKSLLRQDFMICVLSSQSCINDEIKGGCSNLL